MTDVKPVSPALVSWVRELDRLSRRAKCLRRKEVDLFEAVVSIALLHLQSITARAPRSPWPGCAMGATSAESIQQLRAAADALVPEDWRRGGFTAWWNKPPFAAPPVFASPVALNVIDFSAARRRRQESFDAPPL
jgi:hypothetical protein